ncbi:Uu.00g033070.m01.CDS01 [Anthostomella pinea]|uniref:Uu.00g033070.m01.CDS01 n=1 Tax=Anthostomella pinea TaxID=933095 RepID=A0AAI8V8M7_9PEZI|nr:Uu.00g033070.m01.CDS01 [Anthostomella pinea]
MFSTKNIAILLPGLTPSAIALPNSSPASPLAVRDDLCGASSFNAVPNPAPLADCQGLLPTIVDVNLDHPGGVVHLFQNGACSVWIYSDVPISFRGQDISDILTVTIDDWTTNGLTGAAGIVGCSGGTLSWTIVV